MGVESVKPKVFQDIDDALCDIRMDLNDKFRQIRDQTMQGAERSQFIFERVGDFEKSLTNMQDDSNFKRSQIAELNRQLNIVSKQLQEKLCDIEMKQQKLEATTAADISLIQSKVDGTINSVRVSDALIK